MTFQRMCFNDLESFIALTVIRPDLIFHRWLSTSRHDFIALIEDVEF
jgi:hypothetical protein